LWLGQIRDANGGNADAAFFVLAGAALLGGVVILLATARQRKTAPA
jgi:hypothetical protein